MGSRDEVMVTPPSRRGVSESQTSPPCPGVRKEEPPQVTMESKWETWTSSPNRQSQGNMPRPSPSHQGGGGVGGQRKRMI